VLCCPLLLSESIYSYWWATHEPSKPDYAKIFYFMENWDISPGSEPFFNNTLYRYCSSNGGANCTITERGIGLQSVGRVFEGEAITNYSSFTALLNGTLDLPDDVTTFSLVPYCPQYPGRATGCPKNPPSVAEGFLVHENGGESDGTAWRLVIAVQLVEFDLADPMGEQATVHIHVAIDDGAAGFVYSAAGNTTLTAQRVDVAGHTTDLTDVLKFDDDGAGISLVVPVANDAASVAGGWGLKTVAPFFVVLRPGRQYNAVHSD
jgi:hypothetical protein